ncbi:thiol-disulfide oxidoreductase DCC family protein [Chitinimonas koreensis]|uniref:thiol-disulfide oxidoreductase DCC family protein n=1 Tax=Chitinimonas koreensis TaxID=356302 RepID=UPI000403D9B4|nr:DCC1-like thiol-disulfide oxidoreductase family protein [Chitinimonas koreensis]QNM96440.1 DUF393 domain-containing protein [Chitinimonas koreensis]
MTATLTLFYDSRCPLCVAEMRRLAGRDRAGRLAFRDMHGEGFDAAAYGTTLAAMDAELHGVDASGRLLVGIDCIAAAYRAVGRGWLVWPLTVGWSKPLWRRAYRWFARNRYRASRWFGYADCRDGVCDARLR